MSAKISPGNCGEQIQEEQSSDTSVWWGGISSSKPAPAFTACFEVSREVKCSWSPEKADGGSPYGGYPKPHLSHELQQADVDGDQALEALIREAQTFHEEQQLCGAACVLDHMAELLAAQDMDITLAEEGVWREKDPHQASNQEEARDREDMMGSWGWMLFTLWK